MMGSDILTVLYYSDSGLKRYIDKKSHKNINLEDNMESFMFNKVAN